MILLVQNQILRRPPAPRNDNKMNHSNQVTGIVNDKDEKIEGIGQVPF
jgi:hypothetical protein